MVYSRCEKCVCIYFVMGMLLFVRASQSFGFFYERLFLSVAQNPGMSVLLSSAERVHVVLYFRFTKIFETNDASGLKNYFFFFYNLMNTQLYFRQIIRTLITSRVFRVSWRARRCAAGDTDRRVVFLPPEPKPWRHSWDAWHVRFVVRRLGMSPVAASSRSLQRFTSTWKRLFYS